MMFGFDMNTKQSNSIFTKQPTAELTKECWRASSLMGQQTPSGSMSRSGITLDHAKAGGMATAVWLIYSFR
eukprot:scaffold7007_cov69-Cyclotella_meneghiniana.AAC.3